MALTFEELGVKRDLVVRELNRFQETMMHEQVPGPIIYTMLRAEILAIEKVLEDAYSPAYVAELQRIAFELSSRIHVTPRVLPP